MPETPPSTNSPAGEPNLIPPVRMSIEQALDRINILEAENKTIEAELTKAKTERDQANSVLYAQVRASYLNKARALTQIPETQLHKMGNDELESIVKLAEQIKRPNPKSIMFSADHSNPNDGLIDLYSERVKRGRD